MKVRAVDAATLPFETVKDAVAYIAENLREADREELRASLGPEWGVEEALRTSWLSSRQAWLIVDETQLPVAITGVAPHFIEGLGVAWMMGTEGITKAGRDFSRKTRWMVEQLHKAGFKVLFNYVDARNELAMRWLEWAGFKITGADPRHGPEQRLFLEFTKVA